MQSNKCLKSHLLNINTQTENKIALGSMLPVMTIDSPKANKKIIKPAYSGFVFRKICNFSKDTIWFQKIFLLLHDCFLEPYNFCIASVSKRLASNNLSF